MSGWFDGSGNGTNSAFYGIAAGHRGRANNQRLRRDRGKAARGRPMPGGPDPRSVPQKYLGFDLVTKQERAGWATYINKGRVPRRRVTGKSKGESINAAKNWVDSQVVTKTGPNMKNAVETAKQKATQRANNIARQETQKVVEQAKEISRNADIAVNRTMNDPMASRSKKQEMQKRAANAKKMAQRMVSSAQNSERSIAKKAESALQQKFLNEEIAKKTMFTETRPNPAEVMPTSTSPGDVAARNRNYTLKQMRTQWKPVSMPPDYIAGKYTVSAAFNPRLQRYVVTIREGTIARKSKTFDKKNGEAAKNKFNTFKSIADKRTKYDQKKSKSYTRGKFRIELRVQEPTTLAGGLLSGLMNMFGLGRMSIDQIAKENRARSTRGEAPLTQAEIIPPAMRSRSQSTSTKEKTSDVVISQNDEEEKVKSAIVKTAIEGDIEAMPEKKAQMVLINTETGKEIKGPPANYDQMLYEFNTSQSTLEHSPEMFEEMLNPDVKIVLGIDQKPVTEVPTSNGDGGDITKTNQDNETIISPAATVPAPAATVPAPTTTAQTTETTVTQSENYDVMVNAAPAETVEPTPASSSNVMTDGDFYRTYQRPQEYRPATTYTAQTTTVDPAPASPALTTNQVLGIGGLALAGYMYTKQSSPRKRRN